jgi:hypothetical protein
MFLDFLQKTTGLTRSVSIALANTSFIIALFLGFIVIHFFDTIYKCQNKNEAYSAIILY